jgi:hypothetical protein
MKTDQTAGKIILLYILISKFLGDRKTKDSEKNGNKHSPHLICS